jgi:F-type H+-transporting ATPase subunit b
MRKSVYGALAAGLATFVASAAALAKEGQGGMPQLDYHLFAPQLVWLAIAFLALYLVMSRLAVPAISDTLEKRQAKIQGDLDAAEKANEEARSLIAEYQKRLADTREQARKLMRERGEADSSAAGARLQALHDRLAAQIAEAEKRISAQRDEVMTGLEQMAKDIGLEVYAKLAGQPADQSALAAKVTTAAAQGTGGGGTR